MILIVFDTFCCFFLILGCIRVDASKSKSKQVTVNQIISAGNEWGNPSIPDNDSLHPLSKSM